MKVTLIGGYEEKGLVPRDAKMMLELLLRNWSPSGTISETRVVVAAGKDFTHSRHIRFGGQGYFLDEGLDRLESPRLWAPDGLMWKYRWSDSEISDMTSREARVIGASTSTEAIWTSPAVL